jgi:hypothetical protein
MTITAISRWKGGETGPMVETVRKLQSIAAKYGAEYQLGRIHTGLSVGDWLVVIRHADWASYGTCQAGLAADAEYQALLAQASGLAERIERDIVVGIDL